MKKNEINTEKKILVHKDNIKLTDAELNKFMSVLGIKEVKYLFIYNKIYLSSKQLDYLLSFKD